MKPMSRRAGEEICMPGLKQNPKSKKSTPIFELRRNAEGDKEIWNLLEFSVHGNYQKVSMKEKLSDESGIRTHAPEDQISETSSAVDI